MNSLQGFHLPTHSSAIYDRTAPALEPGPATTFPTRLDTFCYSSCPWRHNRANPEPPAPPDISLSVTCAGLDLQVISRDANLQRRHFRRPVTAQERSTSCPLKSSRSDSTSLFRLAQRQSAPASAMEHSATFSLDGGVLERKRCGYKPGRSSSR